MSDNGFIGGWKTMLDGTRVPITSEEADELWRLIEAGRARQAAAYPTTHDTLRAFIDADERMADLGWRRTILDLQNDEEVAVAERGSTGIFRAVWQKPYLHYQGCVSSLGKHFMKRIADLSEDEFKRMEQCEADHAEFMKHHMNSLAQLSDLPEPPQ